MKFSESKHENVTIFKLEGRLDSTSSTEVEKTIFNSLAASSKDVVLDFSGLEYISSAGIRILIRAHKELEKRKGHLFLAALPKPIENILYITGFLPYFKIFETPEQAIAALAALPK